MREVSLIQGSPKGPTHSLAWESLHYRTVCPVFKPGFRLGCHLQKQKTVLSWPSVTQTHASTQSSANLVALVGSDHGVMSMVVEVTLVLGKAGTWSGFLPLLSPVSTQDTSVTLATCSWWFPPNHSLVGRGLNFGSLGWTRPAKIHKVPHWLSLWVPPH